jgi:hypothetical protein
MKMRKALARWMAKDSATARHQVPGPGPGQAAVQLRRDLHRIALRAAQAPGPHLVAVVNPPGIAVGLRPRREAERVRLTPADPAG